MSNNILEIPRGDEPIKVEITSNNDRLKIVMALVTILKDNDTLKEHVIMGLDIITKEDIAGMGRSFKSQEEYDEWKKLQSEGTSAKDEDIPDFVKRSLNAKD